MAADAAVGIAGVFSIPSPLSIPYTSPSRKRTMHLPASPWQMPNALLAKPRRLRSIETCVPLPTIVTATPSARLVTFFRRESR